MKILYIINSLVSGGAEKLFEQVVPLINNVEGFEIDVLLLSDKNNVFDQYLLKQGIDIEVVKYNSIYDVRNIFAIKKKIMSQRYDIVHAHLFPTQYWVAIAKIFTANIHIKYITTEHSTHNRRREILYFRPIDKFIFSKYDIVISITENTKENLINWIDPKKKNSNKHIVVENGITFEEIKKALPYRKSDLISGIEENDKLICMVGRFSEAKDQPTLIHAVSKLSEDVHLVFVGEGPLIQDSKKLANDLDISNRVHFLGFRQDIPQILKTIDIAVLSSHWEGFGLFAVEAMAAEKPILVSDVQGLREVVNNPELTFKVEDSMQLSIKIKELLDNSPKAKKAIAYSCKRYLNYDINYNVEKHLKIYKNIIKYN